MTTETTNEMADCLDQMAKLQAKMEYLQQEKNNKAQKEVNKKQDICPNLKVMSDWLDTYGEMIDEIERERVIVEQYQKLNRDRRFLDVTNEEYLFLDNNKELIQERYFSLTKKKSQGITVKKERPNLERARIEASAPHFVNSTYFMKQYIEATHNIFLIQQKKIDELENMIKVEFRMRKYL